LLAFYQPSSAQAAPQDPDASKLPEGSAKKMILEKCTICHGLQPIVTSNRSKTDWDDLITRMTYNGAEVRDDEHKVIVEYLAKSFPSASGAAAAAPAQKPEGASAPPAAAQQGGTTSLNTQAEGVDSGGPVLPAGAGKELVQSRCTVCHTLDRIVESRRSHEDWDDLVKMMTDFGAELDEKDQKIVIDYLAKSFPDKPAPAKAGDSKTTPEQ
jgi:cytochrome c5